MSGENTRGERHRRVEHAAARVDVDDERPELLAEPERPVRRRRTDSTSKSPPVRIRSSVFSLTIGNGTLPSGSLSVIASTRPCTLPLRSVPVAA